MKKLIIILVSIFIAGCSAKKSKLESKSEDGKFRIEIKGNKPTALDPWTTEINLLAEGFSDKPVVTEIFASNLNEESVKFEWKSNNACDIIFIQSDDSQRIIHCGIEKNKLFLKE